MMTHRRWTEPELELLRDTSLSLAEVAAKLERTEPSVQQKAFRLGIDRKHSGAHRGGKGGSKQRNGKPGWAAWEHELLADAAVSLTEIAELTGRSYSAIRHRASQREHTGIRDYWLSGPAHPNWTGGPQMSMAWRGPDWPEVRVQALERDEYTCLDCGLLSPSGGLLRVHHVIPYRLRPVNDLAWLQTLCKWCHIGRPEHKWRVIPEHIEEMLALARLPEGYGYSWRYRLPGQGEEVMPNG